MANDMTCVIVVGCHRTGTSAVAGVLHHLGVMMGCEFDLPTSANRKGYFEDLEFKSFHHKMDSMKNTWEGSRLSRQYCALVGSREKEYELWGVKDPKLCLYLPVLLDALTGDHRIIHTSRSEDDTVRSLSKAVGGGMMRSLVRFYIDSKDKHLREYTGSTLHIAFDELPTAALRVAEFVGLPMTAEAEKFIEPSLES